MQKTGRFTSTATTSASSTTTGEIIRALTINPERRYHGTGKPVGGPRRPHRPHKNKKPEP